MEKYRVSIKRSAVKEIEAIPQKKERQRIIRRIGQLADNPRPPGSIKLSGHDRYRIRQGVYRIVYGIDDVEIVVIAVKVGLRKNVYRGRALARTGRWSSLVVQVSTKLAQSFFATLEFNHDTSLARREPDNYTCFCITYLSILENENSHH